VATAGRGAHLLRHSLATRMVNEGVHIKDIADILGHASIDTTAIYAKVDITGLAEVALPFAGGVA
jgi:integrase/recombinase XerD